MATARTPSQVSNDILAKLKVTDPAMSYEIGTPERKIVDAVGEAISESYIDAYIDKQSWDIDNLTGLDLEAFLGIFGFGRIAGRKAQGNVQFRLSLPATQDFMVPAGTQVYVPGNVYEPANYYVTLYPAVIPIGSRTVEVPAECANEGEVGNVGAGVITGIASMVGLTDVTNLSPFTGGSDPESDDELRQRFKDTFLRNVAGTEDFYRALCLQHNYISKVQVLGPVKRFKEQLQITNGSATSTITNSKYTWPKGEFVTENLGQEDEVYYSPGTDYSLSSAVPPVLTVINSSKLANGDVIDMEHEYCSKASRNDPANGISNKVDVYINGSQAIDTLEQTAISSEAFSSVTTDVLYVGNFKRSATGARPVAGNRFQRLGSVPLVTFPDQLVINGITYYKGTDYVMVEGTTILRGSQREVAGIEFLRNPPAVGTVATFEYTYNRLPELINGMLKLNKQITTDPLVHTAEYVYLKFFLTVLYNSGSSKDAVDAAIGRALTDWISSLTFGTWIQFSDIVSVVHSVPGVDNVRMTRSTDHSTNYGVQVCSEDGAVISRKGGDFVLEDDQLPVYFSVSTVRKSYNTFQV